MWHGRRIVAAVAAACAALAVVAATVAPAMADDSYTWGYGYSRIRRSFVGLAASMPDVNLIAGGPAIAPAPDPADESQSTPIVVGDTLYAFAFSDARHGTLYATTLDQQTGAPGALRSIVSLTASDGESYNSPGDPSLSPDGQWLAYAAGYHLYWWRVGDWGRTYMRTIPTSRQGVPAFVGSAPLFVPDPTPGSGGWDVCSGSSNGGFACYAVQGPPGIGPYPTIREGGNPYYTSSDGAGITSSAVLAPVGPGGAEWACFGVAAPYPGARIVCLNPHGGGVRVIGRGVIRAPVDSALAYAGGDLWATDQDGGVYAFSAATGQLGAENVSPALTGGGTSIAPPAVDTTSGQVFVVGHGYSRICALRAADLRLYGCWGGSTLHGFLGDFTALTATTVSYGGRVCDLVWSATDGGSVGAGLFCPGRTPVMATYVSGLPDLRPGHNFSALVVGVGPGQDDLVLWSDEAVSAWKNFLGVPQATFVSTPPASTGGGVEVWNLSTPLTVWSEAPVVAAPPRTGVPPGGECVLALTRPAEFQVLDLSTPFQPGIIVQRVATGTVSPDGGGTGPLFSGAALPGCPPPRHGSYYQDLAWEYGEAPPGGMEPEAEGTPPDAWAGPYELWWASGVEVASTQARMRAHVEAVFFTNPSASVGSLPGTQSVPADAWIYTQCPAGDNVAADGTCSVPGTCRVGQQCPLNDRCPSGTQGDGLYDTCCPQSEEPGPGDVGCVPIPPPGSLEADPCANGTYVWKYGQPNPECVGAVLVK